MNPNQTPYREQNAAAGYKQLRRSQTDRKISGVCGGIAEYLNVDPNLIRILVVVGTIVTGGALALAYLVAMFMMPDSPAAPVWNQRPSYAAQPPRMPPAPPSAGQSTPASTPPSTPTSTPPSA